LNAEDCWDRLHSADHGVLATVHPERGVDAVPVVFAVDGPSIVVPIDTVKQKTTTRLQRILNIERDPRCVLLVERYATDWSELWWVRVHAEATMRDDATTAAFDHFEHYRVPGSIAAIIELRPTGITGWHA
jgi:PPOX class probable F420-dependent enzyme